MNHGKIKFSITHHGKSIEDPHVQQFKLENAVLAIGLSPLSISQAQSWGACFLLPCQQDSGSNLQEMRFIIILINTVYRLNIKY